MENISKSYFYNIYVYQETKIKKTDKNWELVINTVFAIILETTKILIWKANLTL